MGRSYTCRPYLDKDGRRPAGPPIVVTAADKTEAILKATMRAIETGIAWAVITVDPPGHTGRPKSHRQGHRP